jgi:hypothetical protein
MTYTYRTTAEEEICERCGRLAKNLWLSETEPIWVCGTCRVEEQEKLLNKKKVFVFR